MPVVGIREYNSDTKILTFALPDGSWVGFRLWFRLWFRRVSGHAQGTHAAGPARDPGGKGAALGAHRRGARGQGDRARDLATKRRNARLTALWQRADRRQNCTKTAVAHSFYVLLNDSAGSGVCTCNIFTGDVFAHARSALICVTRSIRSLRCCSCCPIVWYRPWRGEGERGGRGRVRGRQSGAARADTHQIQ